MPDYSVYGGSLRSEIPFAALPPAGGTPRWELRCASGSPLPAELQQLGEDEVDASTRVRLFRHAGGFRLEYDDTGVFDVDATGTTIDWYAGQRVVPEAVQLDVLGRVLPTAMHASGALCLHGSAVELHDGAVAFLAPKRHGKSTLAHALARAGARVVTDDVVAMDLEPEPRMRPGVPQLRLLRDSARHLGGSDDAPRGAGGKVIVQPDEATRTTRSELPLAALYLLQPMRTELAVESAERIPLAGVAAAMALLPQTRLAPLLGKSEAAVLLDRAVRLAAVVPVYTLRVARDFARLDEVVSRLLSWHGGAARAHTRESSASGARA
ncbi:MAG TPA: hypothetical protein VFK39_02450 [Gemmatimonadaceae bacterium]|nr:hypothetical protein [Gemmatimonadaceae bacterium]